MFDTKGVNSDLKVYKYILELELDKLYCVTGSLSKINFYLLAFFFYYIFCYFCTSNLMDLPDFC